MPKPLVPHLVVTVTIPKKQEFTMGIPVGAKIVGIAAVQAQSRVQLAAGPSEPPEMDFALLVVLRGASNTAEIEALPTTKRTFAFSRGSEPVLLGPNRYIGTYKVPGRDYHLFEKLG